MQYSDYNNSPYATNGGLARQTSVARQQSIRNSTGSINARGAPDIYSQQAGGRPSSSHAPSAFGQRASNPGSGPPLYSSSSGGNTLLPGAAQRSSSPGGWGSGAKVPISQRLAQVKAVYSAAKLTRSVDSWQQGAGPGGGGGGGGGQARASGQRPTGFTCYLCGQQYGTQSLLLHIPQCQKKWMMVEAQKPRMEQRPLPPMPPELERGVLPTRLEEAQEFNSKMYSYWDKVSLVSCPICARTFRPDAFERHAKVCTPDNPGGPLGPNKHAPPPRPKSAVRPGGYGAGGGGGGYGGGGDSGGARGSPPPARQTGQRPTGFTCYLCGQQYGTQSLLLHIPQCQKKWMMVEAQKPRREQRPLPPMPPELERGVLPTRLEEAQEFNSKMYSYWDKVSLVSCPICARTFRPDAFERHAKVCTPDNPGGPLGPNKHAPPPRPKSAARTGGYGAGGGGGMGGGHGGGGGRPGSAARGTGTPPRQDGQRPRAYMCYLCGQQFGSQSLAIHVPQCYEKWLKVEASKLPKERRQPPPPPPELDEPLPTTNAGMDEFNSRMSAYFNGASLMPCPNCGRTMRPDALRPHMKACTRENPMARPGGGGGGGGGGGRISGVAAAGGGGCGPPEYDDGEPGELELCVNCGRKMRPDALVKHQRMCTADKPMKPLRTPGGPSPGRAPAGGGYRTGGQPGGGSGEGNGGGMARPQGDSGGDRQAAQYDGDGDDPGPEPPKVSYDLSLDAGGDDDEEARIQCGSCGRKFLPEAFEKHNRVCAKVFAKKRKVFNSTAKRIAGTDAAGYYNPRAAAAQRPTPPAGPVPPGGGRPRAGNSLAGGRGGGGVPMWKAQSDQLRQAMQAMRKVGAALARGEDIRNVPYVPSGPDPSLVQCPTCGRRYNAKAAERHIPNCASIVSKPKFLKAGTGGAGQGAPASKPLPRW